MTISLWQVFVHKKKMLCVELLVKKQTNFLLLEDTLSCLKLHYVHNVVVPSVGEVQHLPPEPPRLPPIPTHPPTHAGDLLRLAQWHRKDTFPRLPPWLPVAPNMCVVARCIFILKVRHRVASCRATDSAQKRLVPNQMSCSGPVLVSTLLQPAGGGC